MLHPITAEEFLDDDTDFEGVEVDGVQIEDLLWTGRRRLDSSRASGLIVGAWTARGAGISDSVIDRTEVRALSAPGSGWRGVEVRNSRFGSVEAYDSTWRAVHFVNCKLGYVNLRDARLTDVCFTDCIVGDLDLMRATATRIALPGTRITRLEITGAKLDGFDLRGAELAAIDGLDGLRGAIISADQLLDLAPLLADRLGVTVE